VGVESIIKVGITEIVQCESCSSQKFIVEEWSQLLVSKTTFSGDFAKFSIVFWSSISWFGY
jgi:hypothetical protein